MLLIVSIALSKMQVLSQSPGIYQLSESCEKVWEKEYVLGILCLLNIIILYIVMTLQYVYMHCTYMFIVVENFHLFL